MLRYDDDGYYAGYDHTFETVEPFVGQDVTYRRLFGGDLLQGSGTVLAAFVRHDAEGFRADRIVLRSLVGGHLKVIHTNTLAYIGPREDA